MFESFCYLPLSRTGKVLRPHLLRLSSLKFRLLHHPLPGPARLVVHGAFRLPPRLHLSIRVNQSRFSFTNLFVTLHAFESTPSISNPFRLGFPKDRAISSSHLRESLVLRALRPTPFRDGLYTFLLRGSARYYPRHYPFRASPNSPGYLRRFAATGRT